MRRLVIAIAVVVGAAAGATVTSALRDDPVHTADLVAAPASVNVTRVPAAPVGVLLVWTPGGLPGELAERVAAVPGVKTTTVVFGDTVQLVASTGADGNVVDRPGGGRTIPLDAIGVDCATWSSVMPLAESESVCSLGESEALLGETSAKLRRLGPGSSITLSRGVIVHVAGVVDDATVGAAELVLRRDDAARTGVHTPRYLLATYAGDRAGTEAAIRAATAVPLRVRGPGETPWLRHGDAVLPAALVKTTFGEFAARPTGNGALEIDPAWAAANLVTVDLPILGRTTCNRALLDALRSALTDLAKQGLAGSLDHRASGCWNPRTIVGTDQPSRHAWGVAVDLVPLPRGTAVIQTMERWGFTWGGNWIDADPVHFEYVGQPAR